MKEEHSFSLPPSFPLSLSLSLSLSPFALLDAGILRAEEGIGGARKERGKREGKRREYPFPGVHERRSRNREWRRRRRDTYFSLLKEKKKAR